jgi:hypothetical protein
MNRRRRRAAKAKGSIGKLDRVVAIHEAGHAVARVLVAADFGWSPEETVLISMSERRRKLETTISTNPLRW